MEYVKPKSIEKRRREITLIEVILDRTKEGEEEQREFKRMKYESFTSLRLIYE